MGEDAVVERRPDGSILVRVPCGNLPAFRSWLLGLLDDAVVLEPPEVRAEVAAWLAAMRRRRRRERRRAAARAPVRPRSGCGGCWSCCRG